jgi:hypothetical protein
MKDKLPDALVIVALLTAGTMLTIAGEGIWGGLLLVIAILGCLV